MAHGFQSFFYMSACPQFFFVITITFFLVSRLKRGYVRGNVPASFIDRPIAFLMHRYNKQNPVTEPPGTEPERFKTNVRVNLRVFLFFIRIIEGSFVHCDFNVSPPPTKMVQFEFSN